MKPLRVGVIGAGSWVASSHLPNLARRGAEVELVAVCRKGGAALEQLRRDWGFHVASEDYRDVLDAGVDVVIVGSPAALHADHAEAALSAGAHVLVEKPFCLAADDAWRLVRLAEANDRHLVVSLGYNYKPPVRDAKKLINDRLASAKYEYITVAMASVTRELLTNRGAYEKASTAIVPDQATWTDPALSGGGYGQAQLSHALGLAFWLTGMEVLDVSASALQPPGSAIELHAAMLCRLAGGGTAVVTGASHSDGANGNRDHLEVSAYSGAGEVRLSLHENQFTSLFPGEAEQRLRYADAECSYSCEGPLDALVDLALGRDVENCSPGWVGARTVEVLERLYAQVPVERESLR